MININNETIKKILNNETKTPKFINPNKIIKQNNYEIQMTDDEIGTIMKKEIQNHLKSKSKKIKLI